jgi:hypothetical protein
MATLSHDTGSRALFGPRLSRASSILMEAASPNSARRQRGSRRPVTGQSDSLGYGVDPPFLDEMRNKALKDALRKAYLQSNFL